MTLLLNRIQKARVVRTYHSADSFSHDGAPPLTDQFRTIVILEAVDGAVGLGETSGTLDAYDAVTQICQLILGKNALSFGSLYDLDWQAISKDPLLRSKKAEFGAVENAVWDLAGRSFGVPIWWLMSGQARESVPKLSTRLPILNKNTIKTRASDQLVHIDFEVGIISGLLEGMGNGGCLAITLIASGFDWNFDIEVVRSVRNLFGYDVSLSFDCAGLYGIAETKKFAHAIDRLNLDYLIDPAMDIEETSYIRQDMPCPIALYRPLQSLEDVALALRIDSLDMVFGNSSRWGGIAPLIECGALCRAFEIDFGLISDFGVGVSLGTDIAMAMALPEINRGVSAMFHQNVSALLVDHDLGIDQTRYLVPHQTGTGFDLLSDRLAQCLVQETILRAEPN